MKRILTILFLALCTVVCRAQEFQEPADSVLTFPRLAELLPQRVTVRQSAAIEDAFMRYRRANADKLQNGYRIRIYYGSGQNARNASQEALDRFTRTYPELAAYREYENPYFRVTVGDYRTKIDAERALILIRNDFSNAIVIRQKMRFPSL